MELERKLQIGTLVTVVLAIIGFAFWLGGLNSTISELKTAEWFTNTRKAEQAKFADELKKLRDENQPKPSPLPLQLPADLLPVGTILIWGADSKTLPDNWKVCDGSELPTAGHDKLFKIIGTTWGGSEFAFRLPDFSGRFLLGAAKARKIGTYQEAMLPPHSHDKGNLRLAGGRNPGTGEMVFKTGAAEGIPGLNMRIYPGPGTIDGNSQSANTVDILGEPGAAKAIPQETLDEQVRPTNAAVIYIIKVK